MDAVLDGAVRVFRERGFHATTVTDLNEATGLTAGSLYKAFGDKRGVFLAAFERYTSQRNTELRRRMDALQSGRDKIRELLRFYAEVSCGSEGRRGCLVVASATALAIFDDEIVKRVEAAMRRTEDLLCRLLQEGQKDGSISSAVNIPAMARCLLALLQGFRVVGKSGRTRGDMLAAADEALRLLG
ncbi:TetR/AcrR family transcriptional regulator [Cedecea colo]|uniref:TetR/AcrR family transcriptional regulator n=2 Tax=Cedecea colo TaxID=2552946 RepID=A0ABX0VGH0_9ENTR|nr:TetR/AcrR family transcriptional regulator [Cedecea colo]